MFKSYKISGNVTKYPSVFERDTVSCSATTRPEAISEPTSSGLGTQSQIEMRNAFSGSTQNTPSANPDFCR